MFLDRDGVINHDSPNYVKTPTEWQPIKGSLQAIANFKLAGWKVVIATNQAGIGKGIISYSNLHAIHSKMLNSLEQYGTTIDAIFFCPHTQETRCGCRKPKPGMFLEIGTRFQVKLTDVIAVGDSLRDLIASSTAGAKPFLVRTGNGCRTILEHEKKVAPLPKNTKVFDDLFTLTKSIIS